VATIDFDQPLPPVPGLEGRDLLRIEGPYRNPPRAAAKKKPGELERASAFLEEILGVPGPINVSPEGRSIAKREVSAVGQAAGYGWRSQLATLEALNEAVSIPGLGDTRTGGARAGELRRRALVDRSSSEQFSRREGFSFPGQIARRAGEFAPLATDVALALLGGPETLVGAAALGAAAGGAGMFAMEATTPEGTLDPIAAAPATAMGILAGGALPLAGPVIEATGPLIPLAVGSGIAVHGLAQPEPRYGEIAADALAGGVAAEMLPALAGRSDLAREAGTELSRKFAQVPLSARLRSEVGAIGGAPKPPRFENPAAEVAQRGDFQQALEVSIEGRLAEGQDLSKAFSEHLNLSKFPDDAAGERRALQSVAARLYSEQVTSQRRGVMTHDQLVAGAAREFEGIQGDEAVKKWAARTPGMNAKSPEELFAMMQYVTATRDHVYELHDKIRRGEGTLFDDAALVAGMHRLGEATASALGAQAEAARSLGVLRRTREATRDARQLAEGLQMLGPDANPEKMMIALDEARRARARGDLKGEAAAIKIGRQATTVDKAIELLQANALTGPPSHVANVSGNAAVAIYALPERFVGGLVGSARQVARQVIGRGRSGDRMYPIEAYDLMAGYLDASWDLFRAAAEGPGGSPIERTLDSIEKLGIDPDDLPIAPLERARIRAGMRHPLAGGEGSKYTESRGSAFAGRTKNFTQTVFWPLAAGDTIFRTVAERGELRALARARGRANGLRGDELLADAQDSVDDAIRDRIFGRENELLAQGETFAREQTLQSNLPPTTGRVIDAVGKMQGPEGLVLRATLLFRRTPANAMRWVARRLGPAAVVFSGPTRRALTGKEGGRAFDEAAGRIITSTAFMTAIIAAHEAGYLSGAFNDKEPGVRQMREARGEREYSVTLPDGSVHSYRPIEPVASLVGATIDAWTAFKAARSPAAQDRALDAFTFLSLSFMKQMQEQSFTQGLGTMMMAIGDPERGGERFRDNLLRMPMPAAIRYTTRRQDRWERKAGTILESLQKDLGMAGPSPELPSEFEGPPYRSTSTFGVAHDTLPPKLDAWGRPIKRTPPLLTNRAPAQMKDDPITEEAIRLKIDLPLPKQKLEGTNATIPNWDHYDMVRAARGRALMELRDEMLGPDGKLDPEWIASDDAYKDHVIRSTINGEWRAEFNDWLEEALDEKKITLREYEIQKHGRREGSFRALEGGAP